MKIPAKSASSTLEDAYISIVRKKLQPIMEARAAEIAAQKAAEEEAAAKEAKAAAEVAEAERLAAEARREAERAEEEKKRAKEEAARKKEEERRRLQLTRVLMAEPNVLLLDEPTNDLDIDTLQELESLLDSWPGTMVVISHDRYLIERIADNTYALFGDGKLTNLPGGIDEYLRKRAALEAQQSSGVLNLGEKKVLSQSISTF